MAGRKSDFTLPTNTLDELFSTQEERDDAKLSKIRDIPLELIDDFPDHPFKVRDDEDIELLEAACFHGFLSVQNIVSDLVKHNDVFHRRMQIVFNEDKSVTHQNLIGSTLPLEIHGDDFDAKLTGDPVRISRAERIDQPICRLYDLQSLNIQERTPPSACFGNSILT